MHALNSFLSQLLRASGEPSRAHPASEGSGGPHTTGWIALPWEGVEFRADGTQ